METIDRRRFVKMGLITGATALASLAIGGCGAPRSEGPASSAGSAASEASSAANASTLAPADSSAAAQDQTPESPSAAPAGKTLVAVFSWSGNTLQVAERISDRSGSDLFRIEPAVPYTTDYDEVLEVARAEQQNGEMPAIAGTVGDWGSYDRIFLGYPVWWYDAPQIIKSFVSQYDFSGKTVIPFCTSGGSQLATTLPEVEPLCQGATFLEGITIPGDTVASHMGEVDAWIDSLELK